MNTITIDNVPDGWELIREQARVVYNTFEERMEVTVPLRKLTPPPVPAGYEHLDGGTFRVPDIATETWLCCGKVMFPGPDFNPCYKDGKRWILRKAWQAPAWMPKGCWLYKTGSIWWLSHAKPEDCVYGYAVDSTFTPVRAEPLAALHGETFTPPTHTKCLQVQ